ncbi:hypothetical protein D3C73_1259360 [compost metagenome]
MRSKRLWVLFINCRVPLAGGVRSIASVVPSLMNTEPNTLGDAAANKLFAMLSERLGKQSSIDKKEVSVCASMEVWAQKCTESFNASPVEPKSLL